jgi:DNA invertase Pin-like site-specific DNA recombinase
MAGQRIGYIRVSSLDQNTQRQLEGVQLERIYTDKASGKDTRRPQLEELLRFLRDGDTLVVHSMDRLARNLDDLRSLVQKFTQKGVRIEFHKEQLVFTGEDSPLANLMLSVMGAFAEFERALIGERQREGITLGGRRLPPGPESRTHRMRWYRCLAESSIFGSSTVPRRANQKLCILAKPENSSERQICRGP